MRNHFHNLQLNMFSLALFFWLLCCRVECAPIGPGAATQNTPKATCHVQINEAFAISSGFFFEIFRECTSTRLQHIERPMRDYKLLILAESPLRVVLAASLGEQEMHFRKEEKLYVFGKSVDGSFTTNVLAKGVQAVPANNEFRLEADKNYLCILINSENKAVLNQLTLYLSKTGYETLGLQQGSRTRDLLAKATVDLLPFCLLQCKPFNHDTLDFLVDVESVLKVTVFKAPLPLGADTSLNACENRNKPGDLDNHQYGKPTPGRSNPCNGLKPHVCQHVKEGKYAAGYPVHVGAPSLEIKTESYEKIFNCESSSPSVPPRDVCSVDPLHIRYNRPVQEEVLRNWTLQMHPTVHQVCKTTLPNEGRLLDRPWIKRWLEVQEIEGQCIYKCFACNLFFELGLRPDFKRKQNIATQKGYQARSSPVDNQNMVQDHETNVVHQLAVTLLEDLLSKGSVPEMTTSLDKYERAQCNFYRPTMALIAMVEAEILSDSSFNSHNTFVDTQKLMGVNLGIHHYYGSASADIMETISQTMHFNLVRELTKEGKKFALIADASTDITRRPLLALLIQSLENGNPIVYFYKLVHLEKGESASELFNSFVAQVNEDDTKYPGFANFVKNKLEIVVTDNANVMASEGHSFYALIRNFTNRKIRSVGCMAHKLELALQRAIKNRFETDLSSYYKFECRCGKFYSFFMSRGSKRFQHLESVALAEGYKCPRLKKFFEIRWSSSHLNVVQSVYANLVPLWKTLGEMLDDNDVRDAARENARSLLDSVNDKTFVIMLVEYIDLLTVFKFMSLELQKGPSILIAKYDLLHEGIQRLKALKQNVGSETAKFLESCSCNPKCAKGRCTLTHFERCSRPKCGDKEFWDVERPAVPLTIARKTLYDEIVHEIQNYFNLDLMFRVFDIDKLGLIKKTILERKDIPKYVKTDFVNLCQEFYNANADECIQAYESYESLLLQIHAFKDNHKQNLGNPTVFWATVLKSPDLQISETIRDFLSVLLVTPFGSSDAERIFSIVNRVKTKERANLNPSTVDDLVRVKFNGVSSIFQFHVLYYNLEYLKNHNRVDDPSHVRKTTPGKTLNNYVSELF